MDFGYPQLTNTSQVKDYIVTPVEQNSFFFNFTSKNLFKTSTINATTTKDSITKAEEKNAIFFDVIETLDIIFNHSDKIVAQFLNGTIQAKSYLTGNPELDLEFNDISCIQDYMFHECVDHSNY